MLPVCPSVRQLCRYSFKSRAASFVQNHDVVVIFNVFMLQLWVLTKVESYFVTLLTFPLIYCMLFFAAEQKIPPVEQPLWTFRGFATKPSAGGLLLIA
jgi:hypothetical protein